MKILMDTHTFIWWDSQQSKLSPKALELCKNPCNTLILSIGMDNPLTLEEVGKKFRLTRERVRQIKEKAIQRLRQSAYSKVLKEYIGS